MWLRAVEFFSVQSYFLFQCFRQYFMDAIWHQDYRPINVCVAADDGSSGITLQCSGCMCDCDICCYTGGTFYQNRKDGVSPMSIIGGSDGPTVVFVLGKVKLFFQLHLIFVAECFVRIGQIQGQNPLGDQLVVRIFVHLFVVKWQHQKRNQGGLAR